MQLLLWKRILTLGSLMSGFSTISGANARAGARGVVWYKGNDMRVSDHGPLLTAHRECESVNHVFCLDPRSFRTTNLGYEKTSLRRFGFLTDSLKDLKASLKEGGSDLDVLIGRPEDVLPAYCASMLASPVSTDSGGDGENYLYCFDEVGWEEKSLLKALAGSFRDKRVPFRMRAKEFCWAGTLFDLKDLNFDPNQLQSSFTGFRKTVEKDNLVTPENLPVLPSWPEADVGSKERVEIPPLSVPSGGVIEPISLDDITSLWARLRVLGNMETEKFGKESVAGCAMSKPSDGTATATSKGVIGESDASDLLPDPRSAVPFTNLRSSADGRDGVELGGGEKAALRRLHHYVTDGVNKLSVYKQTRNGMLGADYSSKLSVYLALGNISARQVLQAVKSFEAESGIADQNTYWLIFELLWRDYMRLYSLKYGRKMFYLGGMQGEIGRKKYPWGKDDSVLSKWREGRTGYPIIDANMRELRRTGFMSNRGRQIVASFLVRDLKQDWRHGAEWFESNLLDHDVGSNWGNWNYAAGVGADPREDRYFNIVKQGNDYDPQAEYVRTWIPEAASLPNRALLDPRILSDGQRSQLGIDDSVLPKPCVRLAMESFPPKGSGGGGRGGGGRGKGGRGGGRGGARSGGGGKAQKHGFVPGR